MQPDADIDTAAAHPSCMEVFVRRIEAAWAARAARVAVLLALAAAVFWVAFDRGSFRVASWTSEAVLIWWAIVLLLVSGRSRRPARRAIAVLGLLTGFGVLQGLSGFWASGAETPFLALDRTLLYAGMATFATLVARRSSLARWADGIALGLVMLAAVAVASRLFPGWFPQNEIAAFLPDATSRLAYPVDYWNGLAVVVALACPLLLRRATGPGGGELAPLALAPFPLIAVTVYLASSRTGAVTAAVSCVLYVALSSRRWAAAGAALTGALGAAGSTAWIAGQAPLVNPQGFTHFTTAYALRAIAIIFLGGVVAAVAYGLLARLFAGRRMPRRLGRAALALVFAGVVAGAVAVHPVRRWDSFTSSGVVPTGQDAISSHFLSVNGNWRWQLWRSAWQEFLDRPLLGHGAGSFEAWWAQHGVAIGFVGNPHSLYVEALGELGFVGLLLVGGAMLLGTAVAVHAALRAPREHRDGVAAAAAAFIAFAIAAGVDWMWELPAVALVGAALLGLALAAASPAPAERTAPVSRWRPRVGTVAAAAFAVVAVAITLAQLDLYLADTRVGESQRSAAAGDLVAAAAQARSAHTLEPWAATPYLQLALVDESAGQLRPARSAIEEALAHETGDWRIWLIAARIEAKEGAYTTARASYDRARTLNPRSPVFATG